MKPKLGKGIYYASIIIVIIALILVMVLFTTTSYTAEEVSVIRYISAYFSFGVVLPLGVTFRELFVSDTFIKQRIIIKFIVIILALIGGVFISLYVRNAKVGLFILFVSIGILCFSLIPTTNNRR